MPNVHPTALVGPECELAENVEIGPYCILSGRVRLGPGVQLISHVRLQGPLTIGEGTQIFPFACLGFPAQDVKFKIGDPTAGVVVGGRCIIRESVTIHAATKEAAPTAIGDRVFMMVNSHVGHDARVGDGVTIVNNSALAGHSQVGDSAILSGNVVLHQFNRIGRLAFVSGGSALSTDVPPFCIASGRNVLVGINEVGLRRSGMSRELIPLIREAYRKALRERNDRAGMLQILEEMGRDCPPILEMATFVREAKRVTPSLRRVASRGPAAFAVPGEADGALN